MPLIEKAVVAGRVDTQFCGDLMEIRAEMGLAEPRYNDSAFLAVSTSKGVLPPFSFKPKPRQ